MRIFRNIGFIIILALSMNACIDIIDLNINTEQRSIVIDGILTDSLRMQEVRISLSSVIGVGNDNILDPVPGATVLLLDDQGNSYPYTESESGVYQLMFQAERDVDYHIQATLTDGRQYQSRPARVGPPSEIDQLDWEVLDGSFVNNDGNFVESTIMRVTLSSSIAAANRPYLRWRVDGMYEFEERAPGLLFPERCYIKNNLDFNKIRIFDTNELSGDILLDQTLVETSYDYRFQTQYAMSFSQYSISKEEYRYWSSIDQIINTEGGLFDPPPGTVVGNLYNVNDPDENVVGYFTVASLAEKRFFISANVTGFGIEAFCTTATWRPNGFGCDDCLKIFNSTKERPEWWEN